MTELFPDAEDFNAYPPTQEEIDALEPIDYAKILYYFAKHTNRPQRTIAIEMWAHAFSAIMKQGNASDAFLEKIAGACQTEFQTRIRVDPTALRVIYDFFMRGVTDQNAALILGSLNVNLPVSVIRFRLMTVQAAYSGLSLFTLIGKAMKKFPLFPWEEIELVIPRQE
ncbi:hypothetical protein QAD02_015368 [Eretmocerus hayati]|uniref:Uncharacterized protein n=1 Tax=Eretmocerus hayati TaxID=131215 RepID=A0ACC2P822_9HYME|nr:hypothetical protein QAD02_015368 [Eretmocerus hayati]